MWWQSLGKQLEAAVNGALSVFYWRRRLFLYSSPGTQLSLPLFLFSVLRFSSHFFFPLSLPKFHPLEPFRCFLLTFLLWFPDFILHLSTVSVYPLLSASASRGVDRANWVVDMCLGAVGGGENNGVCGSAEAGRAEQSVQRGVGQRCQSPDNLPAFSPLQWWDRGEEEREEGPHWRALTCDDRLHRCGSDPAGDLPSASAAPCSISHHRERPGSLLLLAAKHSRGYRRAAGGMAERATGNECQRVCQGGKELKGI